MRHIIAIATVALAGCGTLANTEFDNIEASRYADIATMAAGISQGCKDTAGVRAISFVLESQASAAARYSAVKNNNRRAADAGEIVHQFTVDLNTRYKNGDPSEAYCKLKLGLIEQAADIVARSISKKEQNAPFAIP